MKIISIMLLTLILTKGELGAKEGPWLPEDGCISSEEVAVKVAEIILTPIFGRELVEKEKPFKATLIDGYWNIYGHFDGKPGEKGGVAFIEIAKKDCRVRSVGHGM